jgi:hypothetical protein
MPYDERTARPNSDGSPLFASDCDRANQERVRVAVEAAWGCELRYFGDLCPLDFYALRDGRMVGIVEVKSRSHDSGHFPTVYLNVRKWLALLMAEVGLGVPAVFVVSFADGIRFIRAAEVDARQLKIGGTAQIVKSHSDIEPVILVPVSAMRVLNGHAPA